MKGIAVRSSSTEVQAHGPSGSEGHTDHPLTYGDCAIEQSDYRGIPDALALGVVKLIITAGLLIDKEM
ncbi:MAG TPA: hypothetical protein VF172_08045 [Nitrososphaera sp.]|jgi:hypothetical protein